MWATDRTADYSQTEESAEYVLEESRRKKGGEENQNPGTLPSLRCVLVVETSGTSTYRNQSVIMAINYSITVGTDI